MTSRIIRINFNEIKESVSNTNLQASVREINNLPKDYTIIEHRKFIELFIYDNKKYTKEQLDSVKLKSFLKYENFNDILHGISNLSTLSSFLNILSNSSYNCNIETYMNTQNVYFVLTEKQKR